MSPSCLKDTLVYAHTQISGCFPVVYRANSVAKPAVKTIYKLAVLWHWTLWPFLMCQVCLYLIVYLFGEFPSSAFPPCNKVPLPVLINSLMSPDTSMSGRYRSRKSRTYLGCLGRHQNLPIVTEQIVSCYET